MTRIAILDDYQNVALSLADWGRLPAEYRVTVFKDTLPPGDALVERLAPFGILCAMRERTPFPRPLLERLPRLRLLITAGMRNAAIDLEAARELGITVCGTRAPGHATAELAFGLVLTLARGIHRELDSMRAGGWQAGLGRDLRGATLGLIGLGRLGAEVACFGLAFGMRVIAWSQNLTDARARECGVGRVTKETLLADSDFISIHLRLSERTQGLIGDAAFSVMKPSAYLVNTSRGPIVDEDALAEVLHAGRIAGAALDVYDQEPLPRDHRLRHLPNLLLTPHIGYVTEETYRVFYGDMVENILAYLAGSPVRVL